MTSDTGRERAPGQRLAAGSEPGTGRGGPGWPSPPPGPAAPGTRPPPRSPPAALGGAAPLSLRRAPAPRRAGGAGQGGAARPPHNHPPIPK